VVGLIRRVSPFFQSLQLLLETHVLFDSRPDGRMALATLASFREPFFPTVATDGPRALVIPISLISR
jgi:hypothetical protein